MAATNQSGQPVADLARDLMAIDSTTGREGGVIDEMERVLVARSWPTLRIPVSPGRDCLLARSHPDPQVTLSTHLDTVPPWIGPSHQVDRLTGRGACDAKGIAAAMVEAAGQLRDRGHAVALLFVVGEETTHDGARAANVWIANNLPQRPRVMINGEPTESTLALGTKGALRAIVRTTGRAAHSAYPHLGDSAIARLIDLLSELDDLAFPSDAILGETTVNIGSLSGGVADNVIAPSAEARLMVRLVAPADDVWAVLERWAAGRATLTRGVSVPLVRLTSVPGFETSVAAYATDLPALTNWGSPFLFGPGSVHVAHTDHEYVDLAELEAAPAAYVRLAEAAVASLGQSAG